MWKKLPGRWKKLLLSLQTLQPLGTVRGWGRDGGARLRNPPRVAKTAVGLLGGTAQCPPLCREVQRELLPLQLAAAARRQQYFRCSPLSQQVGRHEGQRRQQWPHRQCPCAAWSGAAWRRGHRGRRRTRPSPAGPPPGWRPAPAAVVPLMTMRMGGVADTQQSSLAVGQVAAGRSSGSGTAAQGGRGREGGPAGEVAATGCPSRPSARPAAAAPAAQPVQGGQGQGRGGVKLLLLSLHNGIHARGS